jgi:hypothetical protein
VKSDQAHPWRTDSRLKDRCHPDFPDDIEVIVHDGGPRTTDRSPELVWVTITSVERDVLKGRVLNQPNQLTKVRADDLISFVVPSGGRHPLLVTEQYLRERNDWLIHPCDRCGLTELFDPPSVLMRAAFPAMPADARMEGFTAFCGACGGVQLVTMMAKQG